MNVLKKDMYRVGAIEGDAKNMVRWGANELLWQWQPKKENYFSHI